MRVSTVSSSVTHGLASVLPLYKLSEHITYTDFSSARKMEQISLVQEVNAVDPTSESSCAMSLMEAIETLQPSDKVKQIIKERRRSIVMSNLGYKALMKAIEVGRNDLAYDLLDKNCKVNLEKKMNRPIDSPLHLAVRAGDMQLVERLLKANASITAIDETGNTPLHLAFLCKKEAIIDRLLLAIQKKSIYANMMNSKGVTHIQIACARKNVQVIKGFLNEAALTFTPMKSWKKQSYRKEVKNES